MSEAAPQCKPDFEYDREIIQNLRVATYMAAAVSRTRQTPSPRSSTADDDVEGLDGLMVCLDNPRDGIDRFGELVLPQLGLAPASS
jgi:hypothetical protein